MAIQPQLMYCNGTVTVGFSAVVANFFHKLTCKSISTIEKRFVKSNPFVLSALFLASRIVILTIGGIQLDWTLLTASKPLSRNVLVHI